jgi:intracellular sulfur oxidation DsrE/DsrF family protein
LTIAGIINQLQKKKMRPYLLFIGLLLSSITVQAQFNKAEYGPVIDNYGPTFAIDDPDFPLNPDQEYKLVFDIHNSPEDPTQVNPMIETLARFLNMHAKAGVPMENLKVVGVIHNRASKDAMNNEYYKEEFGVDNPNIPLMEALEKAGAKIYMCGQSIHARKVNPERLAAPVKTALSAMTVFVTLQGQGYQLIRF